MKKILCLTLIIQLFLLPFSLWAEHKTGIDSAAAITTEQQMVNVNILLARVDEIRIMEMNSMSSAEKTELRKELKSIKQQLRVEKKSATNGPVKALIWIIIGAGLGIIVTLLFLLGAFN